MNDGAGAIALFLFLSGPAAGLAIWGWIKARYRNRGARYMPERVVAHTVTKLTPTDAFTKKIVSRSGSIDGRNDGDPSMRAPQWKAIKS